MRPVSTSPTPRQSGSGGRAAALVAAGILASRLAGFARATLFAKYLGQHSDAADAFSQAFRIPNFLQNLFGEGTLSASFIPVYAGLLGDNDRENANRVARTVFAWLALLVSVFVLLGVLLAPALIVLVAPGYEGPKRALTAHLVQILFPGIGLLVLSAWCLAILNSHGRFFLSYAAPVVWNAAMIASLLTFRHHDQVMMATSLAWGAVIGSAFQVALQLPAAWRFVTGGRGPRSRVVSNHVRSVLRNFVPVLVSRGVVQLSAYVDAVIASYLGTGAATALMNAQLLYTLPVSLFAMSVAAAELPAMSVVVGARESIAETLRARIERGQRAMAAFVIPSALAFLAFGDVIAGVIFQRGRFTHDDAVYVWAILGGSALGLLSSAVGRLYSAGFYALGDTRTPLRFALIRVSLVAILGYLCAMPLPRLLGLDVRWGAAGLTSSAGLSGWVEFLLLRHGLSQRIGRIDVPVGALAKVWLAAAIAGAVATAARLVSPVGRPMIEGAIVIGSYAAVFVVIAQRLGVQAIGQVVERIRRGGTA